MTGARLGSLALLLWLVACGRSNTQEVRAPRSEAPSPSTAAQVSTTEVSAAPSVPARVSGVTPVRSPAPLTGDPRAAVQRAHASLKNLREGKNADYIPALAKVDSNLFGVVVVTTKGEIFEVGDTTHSFSIQSISKVFTLSRVLEELGLPTVEKRIGTDATGQAFNSIIAVETNDTHRAGNPFVNPGAIATVGLLPARSPDEKWSKILATYEAFAGRKLEVDATIYKSESATNTRNRSIAWLLGSYGVIDGDPAPVLDVYTRQCSVAVNAHDLAVMGATLANGGVHPITKERVVSPETAAHVLSMMMTAGLYETSGTWSIEVGVPAKSGVGGGILAVVPGRYAVGTFSSPLDEAGNSVRGQRAVQSIVKDLGGNVFLARSEGERAPSASR